MFIGFEAGSMERAWLTYMGWQEVGTVSGRNRHECERRFFETWLDGQALPSSLARSDPPPAPLTWRRLIGLEA